MPGYRSGVQDWLTLSVVPAPADTALRGLDAKALTWFEERMQPAVRAFPSLALPAARYAVDFSRTHEMVVYSEQCLARDLCFTWQRWSASIQQLAAKHAQ
jgi:hypothetical protein